MADSQTTAPRETWSERVAIWAAAYRDAARHAREIGIYHEAADWDRLAEKLEADPIHITEHLSEIALAWRAVGDHEGIVVEAQGDDAAATWNRLFNLLDPLIGREPA